MKPGDQFSKTEIEDDILCWAGLQTNLACSRRVQNIYKAFTLCNITEYFSLGCWVFFYKNQHTLRKFRYIVNEKMAFLVFGINFGGQKSTQFYWKTFSISYLHKNQHRGILISCNKKEWCFIKDWAQFF